MWKVALTLWFSVVTLIGHGHCCCTDAKTVVSPSAAIQSNDPRPVEKSCCHRSVPAPEPEVPTKPIPAKKCPCERTATAAVVSPESSHEVAIDSKIFAIETRTTAGAGEVRSTTDSIRIAPFALSGRALLTAYSILRC